MKLTDNCCGCTACENICKQNAITMQENEKGFLVPFIDNGKCVNCGLCNKVCPQENFITENLEKQSYYAVKRKNDKLRAQSQSGGAFSVFAEYILKNSGIVYGVYLNNNLEAEYLRVSKLKDLKYLKGSKYVQARLGNIFCKVKNDLTDGKTVLFSGTPCYVSGLKKYLDKEKVNTNKLLTIDLICHGVPSPKLYREYKNLFSALHNNKKIKAFNFRYKGLGWGNPNVVIDIENKHILNNEYLKLFYSECCLRNSCYSCLYTNLNRVSDITVGDCWSIGKFAPDFDDNKGCSLVLCNTNKGRDLFDSTNNQFYIHLANKEQIMQPNLEHPTLKPEDTDIFWEDYNKYGLEYILYRYCGCDIGNEYEVIYKNQFFKRVKRKLHNLMLRCFYM